MMQNGQMRNLLLYYVLSAAKEMGVSLPLLLRRMSKMASDDIDYISQTFFQGKLDQSTHEAIIKDVFEIMKESGLVEDIKIDVTPEGDMIVEVTGCEYLPLVAEATSHGYTGCPMCLIASAGAIAVSVIKNSISFNSVETETDLTARKCRIRMGFVKV